MKRLRKIALRFFITLGILYILVCTLMYFFQETLIFHPKQLSRDHEFAFVGHYSEVNIRTEDGTSLNGLLFKSDSSMGLFFYLHGNAGALDTWGNAAKAYTDLGYDFFIMDYRGYGKSEGEITGEKQFYEDIQLFYDSLKLMYEEKNIIIAGYSIGTGPAAQLASVNNPKMLLLQAPYYSLTDMMQHTYPIVPAFLLKYKFATNEFIQKTKAPVVIFHGDEDEIIYYGSSEKLKQHFKKGDTLVTLKGLGHNGMNKNEEYKIRLAEILAFYDLSSDGPPFKDECKCDFEELLGTVAQEKTCDMFIRGKNWNPDFESCPWIWGEYINNVIPRHKNMSVLRIHLMDLEHFTYTKDTSIYGNDTIRNYVIAIYYRNNIKGWDNCIFDPFKTGKYPKPKHWAE